MNQLIQWFSMHGYAHYIWTAYGLVFVVLGANVFRIRLQGRRIRKAIQKGFNA